MKIFTSVEIAKIIGSSVRQLQYWDETGLIYPSIMRATGRGTRRLYSEIDLLLLAIVKRLLDAGMSVQCIRHSITFLQKLLDSRPQLAELVLVSDGSSVYAYHHNDTILGMLHENQQVFRLRLGDLAAEFGDKIGHVYSTYIKNRSDDDISQSATG